MTQNKLSELNQYIGSETWTSAGPWFRNVIYSDGAVRLAEIAGAWWLLEAIASHLTSNKKLKRAFANDPELRNLHFWYLKKHGNGAILACRKDKGVKPAAKQVIPYTDFPFDETGEYVLYCGDDGPGTPHKIFLSSEY